MKVFFKLLGEEGVIIISNLVGDLNNRQGGVD